MVNRWTPQRTRPEGATSPRRRVTASARDVHANRAALRPDESFALARKWTTCGAREPRRELSPHPGSSRCASPRPMLRDRRFGFFSGAQVESTIIGADFSHTMLVRAREKAQQANGAAPMPFLEADALRLPFADESFDLVTSAFGFRNLVNYEEGLREISPRPETWRNTGNPGIRRTGAGDYGNAYRYYTKTMLPKIGGWISGDAEAYAYLPKSVARFFRPEELASVLAKVGYSQVHYRLMTLGSVALHLGVRP